MHSNGTGYRVAVVVLLGCLGACSAAPEVPGEAAGPEPQAERERPSAQERQAATLERWLDEADAALSDDRLLTPVGDNAHDRYRAALLLDPHNTRAVSGLQSIVIRYLDLSRMAATRGALAQAETFLERAREVDDDNPLVQEMAEVIATERERRRTQASVERDGERYALNAQQLSERAPELVEQLQALAKTVEQSGAFVWITARTDAEGRWIYQQMREAVPGYLLRGDIHLGSPPRIELEAP